jgi:hypothetical protein
LNLTEPINLRKLFASALSVAAAATILLTIIPVPSAYALNQGLDKNKLITKATSRALQNTEGQSGCSESLQVSRHLREFPILNEIQMTRRNVRPEDIEPLKQELKQFLAPYRGQRILVISDSTNVVTTSTTTSTTNGTTARRRPGFFQNLRQPVRQQSSGVVTVMKILKKKILEEYGLDVRYVTPEEFGAHYQVGYQDVVLVAPRSREFDAVFAEREPMAVHIMSEGLLGRGAKSYLERRQIPFTTAYHTDYSKYVLGAIKYYA